MPNLNGVTEQWTKMFIRSFKSLAHNICDEIINVSSYKTVAESIISPKKCKCMSFLEENDLQD